MTTTQTQNEMIAELGYKVLRCGDILSTRGYKMKTVIKNGYEQLNITINGKTKSFLVHRLVAQEFIPNHQNKPEVNHVDGDKRNNDWKKLRMGDTFRKYKAWHKNWFNS